MKFLPLLHLPMHRIVQLCWTFPPFVPFPHFHVVFFQHTQQVGLSIKRFSRKGYVGNKPLRPVILQCPLRDMQNPAHVIPRQVDLPVHCRTEMRRHGVYIPHALLQRLKVRTNLLHVLCDHLHIHTSSIVSQLMASKNASTSSVR